MPTCFRSVNQFSLNVGLSGQATEPGFALDTDLDNQLASAFMTKLRTSASARFNAAEERLQSSLSGINPENLEWLQTLQEQRAQGVNTQEALQEILSAELNDLLESEQERALRKTT